MANQLIPGMWYIGVLLSVLFLAELGLAQLFL